MANNRMKGSSYTGAQYADSGSQQHIEAMKMVMKDEPEMTAVLESAMKKYGLDIQEVFGASEPTYTYQPGYMIGTLTGASGTFQPAGTISSGSGQTTNQPTSDEIDMKLMLLLSKIPIADPGKIITSEYHNSLRDAVRAIADRIGLSVSPVSESKILSFAPNFQPPPPKDSAAGGTSSTTRNKWEIYLNRASIPTFDINFQEPVSGGFVVQLPDNSTVLQMIVRGERLDDDHDDPEKFNVRLNRLKLGKGKTTPTVLIDIDLKKMKLGYFEEKNTVKLSDDDDSDAPTAKSKIDDLRSINNKTHLYYVTADWEAGLNTPGAAKSNIQCIQIFCAV